MNISAYTKQLVAIIDLSALRPTDPTDNNPDYIVNVLAKNVTGNIEVLVLAKNAAGLNQFKADFPDAGIIIGDGTPDNHNDWIMLAFPREVHDSTSPVEIFNRGKEKLAIESQRILHEHGSNAHSDK